MSLKAEETKVVTIENQTIAVSDLPPQARQLIQFYDHWKQDELETRSRLMAIQTAMKGLAQQIANVVNEEQRKEAENAANDEAAPAPAE